MRIDVDTDLGKLGCRFPMPLVTFPEGRLGGYIHGTNYGMDRYAWVLSDSPHDNQTLLYNRELELSECRRVVMQV